MNKLLLPLLLVLAVYNVKAHVILPNYISDTNESNDFDAVDLPIVLNFQASNENNDNSLPVEVIGQDIESELVERDFDPTTTSNYELTTKLPFTSSPSFSSPTAVISNIVNILKVVRLVLIYSYEECAKIGTNSVYSFELLTKAVRDLQAVFTEILQKNTCWNLNFFSCVRELTVAKLKNLKLEEQFYLLRTELNEVVDQIGKCGKQIIGRNN